MPVPLRVLVTRPQPSAAATAARLEAMGHVAVLLPVMEVVRQYQLLVLSHCSEPIGHIYPGKGNVSLPDTDKLFLAEPLDKVDRETASFSQLLRVIGFPTSLSRWTLGGSCPNPKPKPVARAGRTRIFFASPLEKLRP